MRWRWYLLLLLFSLSIGAHAEKGGYTVDTHPIQNGPIDTSGADATISFWELPLWIQIAYISVALLTFLGLFKIIPIFGRIKDLLENQSRRIILKYILDNPGCNIAEISDQQKINRGSVKYHLNKLIFEEKVILTRIGKFSRLFQNSGTFRANEQVIAVHLKNETRRMLLWTIFKKPGITNQELANKFDLNKSTVHWHIQQFIKDNIIVSEQRGKYRRYSLNADIEVILLRFMPADQPIRAQI